MSEKRRFKEIAHTTDDRFETVPVSKREARAGRFTYMADQTEPTPVDDYTIDGLNLLVGSLCNVKTARGFLAARLARGKVLPGEHYHVARGADDDETRYLYRYLQNVPAQSYSTPQAVGDALKMSDLERIPVVWPAAGYRRGYTRIMDIIDELDTRTREAIDALDAYGDALFEETFRGSQTAKISDLAQLKPGKDIAARDRNPEGPIPIYSSHGVISACDTPIAKQACIVVGKAGDHVLLQYVDGPSWPTTGTKYFEKTASLVPLPYLFFALRSIGCMRSIRRTEPGRTVILDDLTGYEVCMGDRAKRDSFAASAAAILERSRMLEEQKRQLLNLRLTYASRYISGADDACAAFIEDNATVLPPVAAAKDADAEVTGSFTSDAEVEMPVPGSALAEVLDGFAGNLEADDRLWEFLPLSYLRAKLGKTAFCTMVEDIEGCSGDKASISSAIDRRLEQVAKQDAVVAFLPNLSYAQSLLDGAGLTDIARKLGALEDTDVDAFALGACYARLKGKNGSLCSLSPSIRALVAALLPGTTTDAIRGSHETLEVYDPAVGCGDMLDIAFRTLPAVHATAYASDFQDELMTRMMLSLQPDLGLVEGATGDAPRSISLCTANVLESDSQPSRDADLSICLVPETGRFWTKLMPSPDDPRWVFGAPAKNRMGDALIQQCLAHTREDGLVILLVADEELHASKAGAEIRAAWAESGLVKAVIALPGRIVEGRAPLSIVIMGARKSDAGTLFIDAQTLGTEIACAVPPVRMLDDRACKRIVDALARWSQDPTTFEDEPGFSCVASSEAIAAAGGLLTPWTYVEEPAEIPADKRTETMPVPMTDDEADSAVKKAWRTYDAIENGCNVLSDELCGYLEELIDACNRNDASDEETC